MLFPFSVMYPDVPVWVNDLYYNLFKLLDTTSEES